MENIIHIPKDILIWSILLICCGGVIMWLIELIVQHRQKPQPQPTTSVDPWTVTTPISVLKILSGTSIKIVAGIDSVKSITEYIDEFNSVSYVVIYNNEESYTYKNVAVEIRYLEASKQPKQLLVG